MAEAEDASNPDIKEATAKLNEGLSSCRAVIRNYRLILTESDEAPLAEPDLHGEPPETR